MKTNILFCLIAASLKSIACFAATPEFDKVFTEALLRVSQEAGNDEPGRPLVMPQVMDDLRKHGATNEIGEKITKVLRGPVNQE